MAKPPTLPLVPSQSPRGSLLLSDIVINRGIIRPPDRKTAPRSLRTSPPRAVNFSAAHSGTGKGAPWDEGGVHVGVSGIGRDIDRPWFLHYGEVCRKMCVIRAFSYSLISVSHLCRASCRDRPSRVRPTSFTTRMSLGLGSPSPITPTIRSRREVGWEWRCWRRSRST